MKRPSAADRPDQRRQVPQILAGPTANVQDLSARPHVQGIVGASLV